MSYIQLNHDQLSDLSLSKTREVLLVNRLGAYCSTTVSCCNTRKYHGLLVVPQDKIDHQPHVLLSGLDETVLSGSTGYALGIHQYPGIHFPEGQQYLKDFSLESVPKWVYHLDDITLEKEILLSPFENRVMIKYHVISAARGFKLQLRPFVACRNIHTVRQSISEMNISADQVPGGMKFQLFEKYDPLFFQNSRKGTFALVPDWYHNMEYEREKERGYEHHESLLQPGFFEYDLREGEEIVFSCSTREVNHRSLRRDFAREKDNLIVRNSFDDCLLAASEQFIVRRNEHHQVIAGWPWFGRWGRDTFISLPGLTVATDRPELFTLVMDGMLDELKDGLFPNTGIAGQAVYNSIDAPLWCIWALQQYGYQTNDLAALWRKYSNTIRVILENYKNGTRYGIRMQENGLIRSDEENYALTWMDVIANGYPVTERSGVAVEINALWYNAVCFALEAANEYGDEQFIEHWRIYPSLIENSFIKTFWDESKGYLADYVKGDYTDWKVRPNQIIAVSVPFSPLSIDIAAKIVDVVQRELLTPRGLRSLSPLDPLYNSTYHGDQNTRDLGYHQGTVWPWLIGPFSEAYLKVNGIAGIDFIEKIYYGFEPAVFEYGLGTIAELYNGDAPHAAGGAIAQAWSVAELLRTKLLIAICRFEQEVPVKISIFSETWLKIR